jgi:hypothetical protein
MEMTDMRIRTDYWAAQAADHWHDWSAVDADHSAGRPIDLMGHGSTKAAAIADLLAQVATAAAS